MRFLHVEFYGAVIFFVVVVSFVGSGRPRARPIYDLLDLPP